MVEGMMTGVEVGMVEHLLPMAAGMGGVAGMIGLAPPLPLPPGMMTGGMIDMAVVEVGTHMVLGIPMLAGHQWMTGEWTIGVVMTGVVVG